MTMPAPDPTTDDARVTVTWEVQETVSYCATLCPTQFGFSEEQAAAAAKRMDAGEDPRVVLGELVSDWALFLADHQESPHEVEYTCIDRAVTDVKRVTA